MTEYVILRENEKETGHWTVVGHDPNAASGKAAIRDYVNGNTGDGTFVAVPARSWQPVRVQVETALKFS